MTKQEKCNKILKLMQEAGHDVVDHANNWSEEDMDYFLVNYEDHYLPIELTISFSQETYAKLTKLATELDIGLEHLIEATMVNALEEEYPMGDGDIPKCWP